MLRYEALSLGFIHHRSAAPATPPSRTHHSFADAPPAVSGPNPFAGGPNPFGEGPLSQDPTPPAGASPARSPKAQPFSGTSCNRPCEASAKKNFGVEAGQTGDQEISVRMEEMHFSESCAGKKKAAPVCSSAI